MPLSPENSARLMALRQKAIAGTATLEELKDGISILRGDRVAAQHASTTSRTSKAAAAAPVDTGSILADLASIKTKLSSGPVA